MKELSVLGYGNMDVDRLSQENWISSYETMSFAELSATMLDSDTRLQILRVH